MAGQITQLTISIRVIEDQLGKGNFDDAGDLIIEIVNRVAPRNIPIQFACETTDSNPWFHNLIVELKDISDSELNSIQQELKKIGLI